MILFALYKYVVAKSGKKLKKKEMMYVLEKEGEMVY